MDKSKLFELNIKQVESYIQEEEYIKAEEMLPDLLEMQANHKELLFMQQEVLMGLQKWKEAAKAIAKLIELDPGNNEFHFLTAYAHYKAGANRKAEQKLEDIDVTKLNRKQTVVYYRLYAELFYKLNKNEQAKQFIEKGFSIVPGDEYLCNTKALLLMREGKKEDANQLLEETLTSKNSSPRACMINKALLDFAKGKREEALLQIEEAYKKYPADEYVRKMLDSMRLSKLWCYYPFHYYLVCKNLLVRSVTYQILFHLLFLTIWRVFLQRQLLFEKTTGIIVMSSLFLLYDYYQNIAHYFGRSYLRRNYSNDDYYQSKAKFLQGKERFWIFLTLAQFSFLFIGNIWIALLGSILFLVLFFVGNLKK